MKTMANLPNLPLIQERFYNAIKEELTKNQTRYPVFEVMAVFLQTWGSTALGFGGFGGQSMTNAYTTVIQSGDLGYAAVFFGNTMAYIVQHPNDKFWEDVREGHMCAVSNCSKYEKAKMDGEDGDPPPCLKQLLS